MMTAITILFPISGEGYIKKKQAMVNIATTSTVKVQPKGLKEFKTHELHNYYYSLASWVELPATFEIHARSRGSIF